MFGKENFNFKNLIFLALVVFAVWFIVQIKDIALIFFAAYVMACSLNPIADKMSSKMPRVIAAILLLLATSLFVVGVFVPVGIIVYKEIIKLIAAFPSIIVKVIESTQNAKLFGFNVNDFVDFGSFNFDTGSVAFDILNKSINLTVWFVDTIAIILSIGMITFYLVSEKPLIRRNFKKLFPPKLKLRALEILNSIETKVGGYIIAQILSMSTVGFFTAMGLMICSIDYALLLGVIAGILDIIPIIGPTVALILGIAAALLKGWVWVLPVIIIYLTAQWISNQLVRPVVFGKFMKIHPVTVIFAFFAAARFLGVWGVILAPAIASMLLTLFDELYIKTINAKVKDENE